MELMGKSEVATQLKVCERTLENLLRRGEFPPPLRLGKKVRWAKAVVDAWFEQQLQPQLQWEAPKHRKTKRKTKAKAEPQAPTEAPVPTEPQTPTQQ